MELSLVGCGCVERRKLGGTLPRKKTVTENLFRGSSLGISSVDVSPTLRIANTYPLDDPVFPVSLTSCALQKSCSYPQDTNNQNPEHGMQCQ